MGQILKKVEPVHNNNYYCTNILMIKYFRYFVMMSNISEKSRSGSHLGNDGDGHCRSYQDRSQRGETLSRNLMEWQSNTSVGLQQHDNNLMLSVNETESLRVKIEELRRDNEASLAELTEVDKENKTLENSWITVREGLSMFSSQVKVASAQLDLLKDEGEDIIKLENERKNQIQGLNDMFSSMSLRNSRNHVKAKEELSLLKVAWKKDGVKLSVTMSH